MISPKDNPKTHCPKCGAPKVSFTSGMLFGAHKRHCDGVRQTPFKIDTTDLAKDRTVYAKINNVEHGTESTYVRRVVIDGTMIEGVVINGWFHPFQDESR